MSDKRQNNQLELAFEQEYRGEAPKGLSEGTESLAVKRESEGGYRTVDRRSLRAGKLQAGIGASQGHKGTAGVDGMTVHDLPECLKQHWPEIREQLLSGTYKRSRSDGWKSRSRTEGCGSLASRRCWIDLSSRR